MNLTRVDRLLVALGSLLLLAGCVMTDVGPTVRSEAGTGKTFETYTADLGACKAFAGSSIKGHTNAMTQRVVDSILSGQDVDHSNDAADHAYIQDQYNLAFSQCMIARGERVPGYAPTAVAGTPYNPTATPADPLVRATQTELIRLGYLKGGADGHTGLRTESAIAAFEQSNGLPVDGTSSGRLLAKLQSTTAAASAVPANWVAPATASNPAAASPPPTATPASGWVTPTNAAAPPTTTSSAGWVTPTKSP